MLYAGEAVQPCVAIITPITINIMIAVLIVRRRLLLPRCSRLTFGRPGVGTRDIIANIRDISSGVDIVSVAINISQGLVWRGIPNEVATTNNIKVHIQAITPNEEITKTSKSTINTTTSQN